MSGLLWGDGWRHDLNSHDMTFSFAAGMLLTAFVLALARLTAYLIKVDQYPLAFCVGIVVFLVGGSIISIGLTGHPLW